MDIQERVRISRLIGQMERKKELCIRLGLENKSTFYGNPIDEYIGDKKADNERSVSHVSICSGGS